jgi:deferrochelatase/peroxidase EfeB
MSGGCPFGGGGATRRGLLGAAAGLAGAFGGSALAASGGGAEQPGLTKTAALQDDRLLPFHGANQNGIVTPAQAHIYFAAFDIVADNASEIAALMQRWTEAAANLTQGVGLGVGDDPARAPGDSGEAAGLPANRLTLTFGFGRGLFEKDGADRFGLARHRPAAFVDLPRFVGDQLVPERTGGDLAVQACSDDPQAAMHAVRQLTRLAYGVANLRWVQSGFLPGYAPKVTPRNLMGFKDGTANIAADDPAALNKLVWVGDEGGAWMRGGTYMVARPIRIALEHWDRMKLGFQEQTVGRGKASGAPLGGMDEFAPLDLDATDDDGNPVIAENAHVRLASPLTNEGAQILRRGYSYDNGVSMVAERWPPWRHALEFDAGLLFICFQRDPRTGFIRIFDRMAKFDMLNQFVTHVGGGLFAVPGGVAAGRYLAQDLFEAV